MLTNPNSSVKLEAEILIISLIFAAVLYTVFRLVWGGHFAGSFLIGFGAAAFDIYALARLLRMIFATGAGWLFVPLGVFRWLLVGVVLFLGFYFYKAEPLPILLGVAIPFVCVIFKTIYILFRRKNNGTSS